MSNPLENRPFPEFDTHQDAACFMCKTVMGDVQPQESGFGRHSGEYSKKCPKCFYVTCYDLRRDFSVCQFFRDGTYEYVRESVNVTEAAIAANHYSSSVGAQIGTTRRVIITDSGDNTLWEWQYGKGVVFPPPGATDNGHQRDSEPSAS